MLFYSFVQGYVLLLFLYLGFVSGLIFFLVSLCLFKVKVFLLKPKKNNKKHFFKKFTKSKQKLQKQDKPKQKKVGNLWAKNDTENVLQGSPNKTLQNAQISKLKFDNTDTSSTLNFVENEEYTIKTQTNFIENNNNKNNSNKPGKKNLKLKNYFFNMLIAIKKGLKNKQTNNSNEQKNDNSKNSFNVTKSKLIMGFKNFIKGLNKLKKPIISVAFVTIQVLVFAILIGCCYLINLNLNFGEIRVVFLITFVLSFMLARTFLNLLAKFVLNFYNNLKDKQKNKKQKETKNLFNKSL